MRYDSQQPAMDFVGAAASILEGAPERAGEDVP